MNLGSPRIVRGLPPETSIACCSGHEETLWPVGCVVTVPRLVGSAKSRSDVGEGWSVQLAIRNIDTAEDAATVVTAYDQEGQAIPGFFEIEGTFELPPLGTRVFRSAGAGQLLLTPMGNTHCIYCVMMLLAYFPVSPSMVISATILYSPGANGVYGQIFPIISVPLMSAHSASGLTRTCHFELTIV